MATSIINYNYLDINTVEMVNDSKAPNQYPYGITIEGGDSSAGMPARYGVLITFRQSTSRAAQIALGVGLAAVRVQDNQTTWLSWQSII